MEQAASNKIYEDGSMVFQYASGMRMLALSPVVILLLLLFLILIGFHSNHQSEDLMPYFLLAFVALIISAAVAFDIFLYSVVVYAEAMDVGSFRKVTVRFSQVRSLSVNPDDRVLVANLLWKDGSKSRIRGGIAHFDKLIELLSKRVAGVSDETILRLGRPPGSMVRGPRL